MSLNIYLYISLAVILILLVLVAYYHHRTSNIHKRLKKFTNEIYANINRFRNISNKIDKRINDKGMTVNDYINYLEKLIESVSEQFVKNSELIEAIFDNMAQGILIIDCNKRIIKINESLLNLFYLDSNKVLGERTMMVFNNRKLEDLINKVLKKKKSKRENIIFYRDEDLYLDIEAVHMEFVDNLTKTDLVTGRGKKGRNVNILILVNNATQEVEFSRLRSQFAANVSHEMRTPLTSIKGYLETAIDTDLKDKKRIKNYLEKSLVEVDKLNFLIKDIMDLSKIEYRRNVIFKDNVNLIEIIEDIVSSLHFLAEKNKIKIEFRYNKNSIGFTTDEELLRQLVRNMVENTIFYAGNGSKLVIDLKDNKENILLDFIDNGIGIAKEDLPYIFQRFYRGKNPLSSKRIGSGLGLSIVKHTLDLHNATIRITSDPGIETRFSIILPKKEKG